MRRNGITQVDDAFEDVRRAMLRRLDHPGLRIAESNPLPRTFDIEVRAAGSDALLFSIHGTFNQDRAHGGVLRPGERLVGGMPRRDDGVPVLAPVRERSFRSGYADRRALHGFVRLVERELARHVAPVPVHDGWAPGPEESRLRDAIRLSNSEHGPEATLRAVVEAVERHCRECGTFLPRDEKAFPYALRRAGEPGGETILAEIADEIEALDRACAPSA
jgi:hypothetical protein